MNLFEAKQIAEQHGFKVVKKANNDNVPPWAKKKAVIKEAKGDDVPPWAKKKAMIKEAMEIVEDAGFKVQKKISKEEQIEIAKQTVKRAGYKVIDEGYGDDDGDLLTKVLEKYVKSFDALAMSKGLMAAKKIVIDDVRNNVGSGISEEYANTFEIRLMQKHGLASSAKYISDCWLKSMGQGVV